MLKEKNLLQPGSLTTFYWKCHPEFMPCFTQENDVAYWNNVEGLLRKIGAAELDPKVWRLFNDSLKRSLKCVLLRDGNTFGLWHLKLIFIQWADHSRKIKLIEKN